MNNFQHEAVPTLIIFLFSTGLLVRVIYQKQQLRFIYFLIHL